MFNFLRRRQNEQRTRDSLIARETVARVAEHSYQVLGRQFQQVDRAHPALSALLAHFPFTLFQRMFFVGVSEEISYQIDDLVRSSMSEEGKRNFASPENSSFVYLIQYLIDIEKMEFANARVAAVALFKLRTAPLFESIHEEGCRAVRDNDAFALSRVFSDFFSGKTQQEFEQLSIAYAEAERSTASNLAKYDPLVPILKARLRPER